MFPEVSQDSLKVDVVVATLYLGVLCNQGISLIIELHRVIGTMVCYNRAVTGCFDALISLIISHSTRFFPYH